MGQQDVAGVIRDGIAEHLTDYATVRVERHGAGGPVEAVLMKAVGRVEREVFDGPGPSLLGIVVRVKIGRRVQDDVDGEDAVFEVERLGQDLYIDLLCVVEILHMEKGQNLRFYFYRAGGRELGAS